MTVFLKPAIVSIWLDMTAPSDHKIFPDMIQGYEIFYRQNSSSNYSEHFVSGVPLQIELKDVLPITLYMIKARAIIMNGEGRMSEEIAAWSGEGGISKNLHFTIIKGLLESAHSCNGK